MGWFISERCERSLAASDLAGGEAFRAQQERPKGDDLFAKGKACG